MVTQAARSLIGPWQCGQYGSTDCFFTLRGRGQSRSCCVQQRPRLEARESSQDPGLAGWGERLTGSDVKRKRARRKWVT